MLILYDTGNAFDIIRIARFVFNFFSQIAYMVIDGFPGIVGVILMPHQVHDNLIGKYLVGIHNEYEQNVELFLRSGRFPCSWTITRLYSRQMCKSPS